MSNFFRPNLTRGGRIIRGVLGAACLIAGIIVKVDYENRFGWALILGGLFGIYEALRGWCLARACGIKTKI